MVGSLFNSGLFSESHNKLTGSVKKLGEKAI